LQLVKCTIEPLKWFLQLLRALFSLLTCILLRTHPYHINVVNLCKECVIQSPRDYPLSYSNHVYVYGPFSEATLSPVTYFCLTKGNWLVYERITFLHDLPWQCKGTYYHYARCYHNIKKLYQIFFIVIKWHHGMNQ